MQKFYINTSLNDSNQNTDVYKLDYRDAVLI